jgi:hypothetical protein
MAARTHKPVSFHGFNFLMTTKRATRDGKVSHLFCNVINGAISGFNITYCNDEKSVFTGLSTYKDKWTDSPDLKVCNRCMRAWRKEQKKYKMWIGTP